MSARPPGSARGEGDDAPSPQRRNVAVVAHSEQADTGLAGFPYRERGYLGPI